MQIILEGHDEPVPAQAGETMLASLLRAGLAFPFSCQAGNCGTCKCQVVSGDVHELEYSEHALSAAERARGIVLACRAEVRDDTVIRRIDGEELLVHPFRT
jgi:ferredoxin-NAD(P)+ reductase (naphthalene dioxygenase ferredoxin-specific)